ncbi:DUF2785 domain-containing protein [Bacillus sp. FJAT-42376]|uniref:DUF2785 domain-containing protein n=1 Tax=Bacillus sp. FJAT-42376 TaxID=2014076 RepID=UPI0013DE1D1D|nr:DUF2785 domain-containing protein [Bacillus sp. FJAT-42376]
MKTADEMLKSRLVELSKNQFKPGREEDCFLLIKEVCRNLGSPDAVLRDELGYTLLAEWVYRQKLLTNDQLHELYKMMISEDMWFYKIGEIQTDSVLMRSFTSLGMTLLLKTDQDDPFLTKTDWQKALMSTVQYCTLEKDLRGYSETAGWMHAAAHVADLLTAFAEHPDFSSIHTKTLLTCMERIMENAKTVFKDEEDERLARSLKALVQHSHLSADEMLDWFARIPLEAESYINGYRKRINWKHLFRASLLQLHKKDLFSQERLSSELTRSRFNNPYI